jgi:hypothetical protein
MRTFQTFVGIIALALGVAPVKAQNRNATPNPAPSSTAGPRGTERFTVPFRDPGMPRKLIVSAPMGNIIVRGYEGQEAIIDVGGDAARRERNRRNVPPGMRRIDNGAAGVDIIEDNNTIRVSGGNWMNKADFEIQVPMQTSVRVKSNFGGEIRIENINGEIEAETMNGEVNITNVSGPVNAHTMNGELTVTLNNVMPDKPMSFSTMNGEINVTMPSSVKANLKLKTNHGEMFTDFDIQMDAAARPAQVEDNRGRGGPFRVRMDSTVFGTINGGGPELQFTTFNGNILIRKK